MGFLFSENWQFFKKKLHRKTPCRMPTGYCTVPFFFSCGCLFFFFAFRSRKSKIAAREWRPGNSWQFFLFFFLVFLLFFFLPRLPSSPGFIAMNQRSVLFFLWNFFSFLFFFFFFFFFFFVFFFGLLTRPVDRRNRRTPPFFGLFFVFLFFFWSFYFPFFSTRSFRFEGSRKEKKKKKKKMKMKRRQIERRNKKGDGRGKKRKEKRHKKKRDRKITTYKTPRTRQSGSLVCRRLHGGS